MARHVEATHRIVIPLPLGSCQALFTPEGEARRVEGWSPTSLHPSARDAMPGTRNGTVEVTFEALDPGAPR